MPVLHPEEMNAAFAAAYNSGNIDTLMSLYEANAVLAPQPGLRTTGHPEIRTALNQFLSLKGKMTSVNRYCMRSGDIALLQAEWTLEAVNPDGSPLCLSSRTSEIVRRQTDGRWLYVIDHAFANDD